MTMQLFLLSLALNTLTIAIPVGFSVYLAVKLANREKIKKVGTPLNRKEIKSYYRNLDKENASSI